MADSKPTQEGKQERLLVLGPTLGPLYNELYNEVVGLHAKWIEYRKLYAKSEKRIDLLNKTAGFFFLVIQNALWENILLHIARLTDPPGKRMRTNLTLQRLPKAFAHLDQVLGNDLQNLVKASLQRCQFVRDWRDKRLAHNDFLLSIGARAQQLPDIGYQNVEDALASFRQIMNRLESTFFQSEVMFDEIVTPDDADTLVYHLAVAARFDERQRERLRQGKPLPEDLQPIPEV